MLTFYLWSMALCFVLNINNIPDKEYPEYWLSLSFISLIPGLNTIVAVLGGFIFIIEILGLDHD